MSMNTGTVRLHRVIRTTPERLFRAFVTPEAMAKWLPPHGFIGKVYEMDPREGGSWRMSFTNFSRGGSHSFGGRYLDVVPGERLRYTSRFDDAKLPGEMTTTVTLRKLPFGTEMHVVQEGIPDVIPVEMCYLGWQESLVLLARLVEADVPG
jgi:uncharacterized protein YndB with AHSA1/START domain